MSFQQNKTILVVEDEVFVRMIAADSLEEGGFKVIEAQDAQEALELLDAHNEVAVLFTDINMPGKINGLELADIVAVRRPEVKIVVTSGREWIENERLPSSGVYVPKPYRPAKLVAVVNEQLGAGRA